MNVVLASKTWSFVILYIENVMIFSKSSQQQPSHTEIVLRLLINEDTTLQFKMCHFLCKSINYLRHVIAPGKLQVVRKATNAVSALRYRTGLFQLRSFSDLCYVYRRFVLGFANITTT